MRFIEILGVACVALLAACGSRPMPSDVPVPVAPAPTAPVARPDVVAVAPSVPLAPARNWEEYKRRVAQRIMQTSAGETFSGPTGDHLRSIPVLQVELNRDGSIRDVTVRRTPKYSPETQQMAIRAVRRAGPFEPVGHLPRPWQYTETFLYNEELKFQLLSLTVNQ